MAKSATRVALVIGIDTCRSTQLNRLAGAVNDARKTMVRLPGGSHTGDRVHDTRQGCVVQREARSVAAWGPFNQALREHEVAAREAHLRADVRGPSPARLLRKNLTHERSMV